MLKKQNIDNALESQHRTATLNESYRQRYIQYTKMVIVVVISLAIIIAVIFLGRFFTVIPSFIIDVLIFIVMLSATFICYFIYADIAIRDKMYFDEINLDNPTILTPDQLSKQLKVQANAGNLLGSINLIGCVGNDCCSTGTVWDPSNSVCVVQTTASGSLLSLPATAATTSVPGAIQFTTLSNIYNIKGAKPNSPNEYENYSMA